MVRGKKAGVQNYSYMCIDSCVDVCVCVYCIYIYIYTHIHLHTCTHTHTCMYIHGLRGCTWAYTINLCNSVNDQSTIKAPSYLHHPISLLSSTAPVVWKNRVPFFDPQVRYAPNLCSPQKMFEGMKPTTCPCTHQNLL